MTIETTQHAGDDREITVSMHYVPGRPGTYEDPADPEEWELQKAIWAGTGEELTEEEIERYVNFEDACIDASEQVENAEEPDNEDRWDNED